MTKEIKKQCWSCGEEDNLIKDDDAISCKTCLINNNDDFRKLEKCCDTDEPHNLVYDNVAYCNDGIFDQIDEDYEKA